MNTSEKIDAALAAVARNQSSLTGARSLQRLVLGEAP